MSTDGGPAFPCDVFDPQVKGPEQHEGMSLRDYFAAAVLQGMMATRHPDAPIFKNEDDASYCYAVADAMLKERAK